MLSKKKTVSILTLCFFAISFPLFLLLLFLLHFRIISFANNFYITSYMLYNIYYWKWCFCATDSFSLSLEYIFFQLLYEFRNSLLVASFPMMMTLLVTLVSQGPGLDYDLTWVVIKLMLLMYCMYIYTMIWMYRYHSNF